MAKEEKNVRLRSSMRKMFKNIPSLLEEYKPKIQPTTYAAKVPLFNAPTNFDKLKKEIIQEMAIEERSKYPVSHYSYENNKENKITVTYNGKALDEKTIQLMNNHSLIVRKLSVLASMANALTFSDNLFPGITIEKKHEISQLIQTLYRNSEPSVKDIDSDMNAFVKKFAAELSKITGKDEKTVIRIVRNAERYFSCEYNKGKILEVQTKLANGTLIQVDEAYGNKLTTRQKLDLVKIHYNPENQPKWFKRLPAWERDWFTKNVPQKLANNEVDWKAFEALSQSSAMQHIPGIKNARTNTVLFKDDEGIIKQISKSFKTSTFVPYEMPKAERKEQTRNTALQVLLKLNADVETKFNSEWGNLLSNSDIKPLIYVQSLLSDVKIGGGSDTQLANEQRKAIASIAAADKMDNVTIITGNDPVNFLRLMTFSSGKISEWIGRWDHTKQVMDYAKNFLAVVKNNKVQKSAEQSEKIFLIEQALSELNRIKDHQSITPPGRNAAAYKVALTEIMVEAMGGITSTNCKSGKDRTGFDEVYRAAILMYFKQENTLPKFDDQGMQRDKFIAIFIPLFNNMKTQEAAASNTPGSFGLKDNARMLCTDIADKLSRSYKASNRRSGLNKPLTFLKDEAEQATSLKHEDNTSRARQIDKKVPRVTSPQFR